MRLSSGKHWCIYLLPGRLSYVCSTVPCSVSKANWPIRMPGFSAIGTSFILVISSVMVPSNPGSIKPAVEWIIIPSRQSELRHSQRATRSYGTLIVSAVTPSTNCHGWSINSPPSGISIVSIEKGFIGVSGWIIWSRSRLYTLKKFPRRKSTLAGQICCKISYGRGDFKTISPTSRRARIEVSESIIYKKLGIYFATMP